MPEGVETRRVAPKANFLGDGEGIVQATNGTVAPAVKTVVGMKISRSLIVRVRVPPSAPFQNLTSVSIKLIYYNCLRDARPTVFAVCRGRLIVGTIALFSDWEALVRK